MSGSAFAKSSMRRLLDSSHGESITYSPKGGGASFSIRAVVDRDPFERQEYQDSDKRAWRVLVVRDPEGTDPPVGLVAPVRGDRLTVARYPDSDETVSALVNDYEQREDLCWELAVSW